MTRFFWPLMSVLIVASLLSSCSSSEPDEETRSIAKNYRYGSYYMRMVNKKNNEDALVSLQNKLKEQGVNVISIGQEYKLVVSADRLFYNNSPRIQWASYALLNDIVDYIKLFNKQEVKVATYTDGCENPLRSQALSMNRSRNIANYLVDQDVGANIIYIRGYLITQHFEINRLEVSFKSVMK